MVCFLAVPIYGSDFIRVGYQVGTFWFWDWILVDLV